MYDARSKGSTGDNQNLMFGLVTLGVVATCFLAVWKGPDLIAGMQKAPDAAAAVAAPTGDAALLAAALPDGRMVEIVQIMGEYDPAGYRDFMMGVKRGDTVDTLFVAINTWTQSFYARHAKDFAQMDVKYFNAVLDLSIDGVDTLSQSGSKFCKGATWVRYQSMPESAVQAELLQLLARSSQPGSPVFEFSTEMTLILMRGLRQAKTKPKSYGPLTQQDTMSIAMSMQGLMMNPDIMALSMSGPSNTAALSKVNFCSLGGQALRTFRSLPDGVKGRLWYSALSGDGGALGEMGAMPRF